MLVIHVSNRCYDLAPPVNAALDSLGLVVLERAYAPTAAELDAGAGLSHWVVGSRNADTIEALRLAGWADPRIGEPLTDDFPDLLRWFGR